MRNRPDGFDIYLVNVKTLRKISQIFVAFSEKLNFTFTNPSSYKSKRNVKISPTVINRVKFQIQILLEGPENRSLFFFVPISQLTSFSITDFTEFWKLKIWKRILAFVYKFEKTETPESIDKRVRLVHSIYISSARSIRL